MHRVPAAAKVPSHLEPSGLYRTDGITVVSGKSGKLLVWDITCPDTAHSYSVSATRQAGAVSAMAEERKMTSMPASAPCMPLPQRPSRLRGSLGHRPWCSCTKDLDHWLAQIIGDERSSYHLLPPQALHTVQGGRNSGYHCPAQILLLFFQSDFFPEVLCLPL